MRERSTRLAATASQSAGVAAVSWSAANVQELAERIYAGHGCAGRISSELIRAQPLSEDPPSTIKEGGIITDGLQREAGSSCGTSSMNARAVHGARLEAAEREGRPAFKTLKIGYNRVFGYYIEVSKSYTEPWCRKRISANRRLPTASATSRRSSRNWKDKILGAKERLIALEYRAVQ